MLPIFKEEMYQLLYLGRILAGSRPREDAQESRVPSVLYGCLLEYCCPLFLEWDLHKASFIINEILDRDTVGMLMDEKLIATPNSLHYLARLAIQG